MALFVVNQAALRELLVGNSGPVAKDLSLRSQRVVNAAKRRCPSDTGRLRGSIRFTITSSAKELVSMIGSDVSYALFVHEGTRPHFPPLSAMQPWAKRHGFPAGTSGAFLVGRAISRRGTRARPFLNEALASAGEI